MSFVVVTIGWLASVCLHEYAHARVAFAAGDTSVAEKGYLSLNPFRYADPTFSLYMPLLFLFLGGIGLPGAAVYIDYSRVRGRAWLSAISGAGPISSLALALLLA